MLTEYIHAVMSGVCAFSASIIGARFFKAQNGYIEIAVGIMLFLLANHVHYKLKFNAYNYSGATVSNILIFISQISCMVILKSQEIGLKWILGVTLILIGACILQMGKDKQQEKTSKVNCD